MNWRQKSFDVNFDFKNEKLLNYCLPLVNWQKRFQWQQRKP